ncbi:DUF4190 domain-containing protein [Agreia bicolorata]|uniref:DUF4190 domain-containing protein n=1 Tax=Agreia bicolorata TaxID=110935 RepID=UPI0015908236|nr:DUF4190 domain-containing protein [Agreia bicolorata]
MLAIISLVSAFLFGLAGIVTGYVALGQIKRNRERGRGLAISGIVIGYVNALATVGVIVLLIVTLASSATFSSRFTPRYTYVPVAPSAPSTTNLGGLSFADGNDLDPNEVQRFSETFAEKSGWALSKPFDGDEWKYVDSQGLCTVTFHWANFNDHVEVTDGDDRATTESYTAASLGWDSSAVQGRLSQIELAYDYPSSGAYADFLVISGSDGDGVNWVQASRAFGVSGIGMYVDLTCTSGGDVDAAFTEVLESTAITSS